MWVFGYGSLMWDEWHISRGCQYSSAADLRDYRRVFNKASIKRWGSRQLPCPTLNLEISTNSVCRGMAFEFPEEVKDDVLEYLNRREGEGFEFNELTVRLLDTRNVVAVVPLYRGRNLIRFTHPSELVNSAKSAVGSAGLCVDYVKGLHSKQSELGIHDPSVIALIEEIESHPIGSGNSPPTVSS